MGKSIMCRLNALRAVVTTSVLLIVSDSVVATTLVREKGQVLITGDGYRVAFAPETAGLEFAIADRNGRWYNLADKPGAMALAYFDGTEHPAGGLRATWALEQVGDYVRVGQQAVIRPRSGVRVRF
jgi:hypothetical protein